MSEPLDQDAVGLASRIRDGELTAREACLASIRRIEAMNETLNAVVGERFDEALDEIERGLPDGPLRGVPILVKDLDADVAGLPSINGSRLFAGHRATADSALVAQYRRAGMVVLGKTNTPELGRSPSTEPVLFGPTRNPWRVTHSPGGSSGGSAAAVAAGLVPVAHGTDSGGSIRIPSAACGLFGLKPTRGRTPGAPYRSHMANPLSVHHALTTSVRDSAALLDVASGQQRFTSALDASPGKLRIGYTTTGPGGTAVDPDCRAAVERAVRVCAELGHELVEAAPDYDTTEASLACVSLMRAALVATIDERLAELGRELREDDIEAFTRVMYEQGRQMSAAELVRALHTAERVAGAIGTWFGDYDLLLTPTLAARTPRLGTLDTTRPERMYAESGSYNAFTGVYNLTGHPAISVPFGYDRDGLPLGVQFVGRYDDEVLLLRVAEHVARPVGANGPDDRAARLARVPLGACHPERGPAPGER